MMQEKIAAPSHRKKVPARLADLIEAEALDLAVLGVRDNGTEIGMALQAEPASAAATFRYYAELIDKVYGEIAPTAGDVLALLHRAARHGHPDLLQRAGKFHPRWPPLYRPGTGNAGAVHRGGIEADVTVTRLAPQQFIIVIGHPSQIRDQAHIRAHARPDWRFELFDATSAHGLLTIHGPKSRAILQALSGDDLSNAAFPFGAAREIDLGFARVWAIRRSFLGELGYELLMPTEFCAHVHEALMTAGAPHGQRHAGMFALAACRLEKGFRHFGHDIGEEDTPLETGLGFAVRLDKPDFVSRAALARQKAEQGAATRHRTGALMVEGATAEAGPYLIHNEPIRKDGALVGHVTSGGWGWRVGAMLGLASLHRDGSVTREWIDEGGFTVRIAGRDHALHVQLDPFHDPAGDIMRG